MVDVEQWAQIRRMKHVEGLSQREIHRRTGAHRDTIRRTLRSPTPPSYGPPRRSSKLDPYRSEIERLLADDATLSGVRVREQIAELGYEGGKTIVDDYLREVRPRYLPRRTFQRTAYRPGEICQVDLFTLRELVSVGHGQARRGYVLLATLGFSRATAGALIFSKEPPDVLWAICRGLWRLGGLPELLVSDREGALHAGWGRPTEAYARLLGELAVGHLICQPRDCQAKGLIENRGRYLRSNFEPGRLFANELDCQDQLDGWCDQVNARTHRGIRAVPGERLATEREQLRPLPGPMPDSDRRWVTRVPAQPYLRFDRNDYSLDPQLVGRRVEVRASQRELVALALDSGEPAARHRRSYAGGLVFTDPAHQAVLDAQRGARRRPADVEVERRPLAHYDALIPA